MRCVIARISSSSGNLRPPWLRGTFVFFLLTYAHTVTRIVWLDYGFSVTSVSQTVSELRCQNVFFFTHTAIISYHAFNHAFTVFFYQNISQMRLNYYQNRFVYYHMFTLLPEALYQNCLRITYTHTDTKAGVTYTHGVTKSPRLVPY